MEILWGNILQSKMQTHVNPVNCCGVMGKGLARKFKDKYPLMFDDYKKKCTANELQIGQPYIYKSDTHPWILNFPTKKHWSEDSRIMYIVDGMDYLVNNYKDWGITSIAIPSLGCGEGGLRYMDVFDVIHSKVSKMDIPIEIYEPLDPR